MCIVQSLYNSTFAGYAAVPIQKTHDTPPNFLYYVEIVAKGESLGEFEYLVLLAVLRLNNGAYGMRVRREIAERTQRDVTIGAVYATLERLAAKGLITSEMSDPTPERGGRAKRSFHLTGVGIQAVNRSRQELESMLEGLAFPLLRGSR